ncbi:hypothetical protein CLOLEP_03156 [[Clostridium] leptum DSM 753]|uniref:Uncharacterized protein n=1 Tax=[Clostridium] leptum DSM 753 TaxID=428125 RepID=A7VX34_9FIRM|nr:hypothetical protein CLOLEP_03156 [[Clostridium] leptum DSM 753]
MINSSISIIFRSEGSSKIKKPSAKFAEGGKSAVPPQFTTASQPWPHGYDNTLAL